MMKQMVIKVESFEETMKGLDALAQLIDSGKRIPESCIRSFSEPTDLLAIFTPARRALLDDILRRPGSIQEIAARLSLDTREVERDIALLAEEDIVVVEEGLVQSIAETVVYEPTPQLADRD